MPRFGTPQPTTHTAHLSLLLMAGWLTALVERAVEGATPTVRAVELLARSASIAMNGEVERGTRVHPGEKEKIRARRVSKHRSDNAQQL